MPWGVYMIDRGRGRPAVMVEVVVKGGEGRVEDVEERGVGSRVGEKMVG